MPAILAGGLRPDNVAAAIEVAQPYAVDVASGVEAEPGRKDHAAMAAFFEAAQRGGVPPDERGRGAVRPLRGPLRAGDPDRGARRADRGLGRGARGRRRSSPGCELLRRDFIGRPTPLYLAERLSERVGSTVYLKREDLAHTGAHKINNAVGQALLAERMGKPRVIAETGAGQHGVATATACALLGLECVVYMGTEDIRRQAPNVERMKLLGAEVAPVEAGARTLKEAVTAAIRDWVANVETTHYVIGSAVGPAPYPALVRDLQRVIGEEAREQALAAEGALPARVIACVGGGSNAIGIFTPFLDDAEVALIGVEAAGEGLDTRPPRRLAAGRQHRRPARLALLGDRRRGGPDPRGALGLRRARLPGRRSRARLPARHRPRQLRRGRRRSRRWRPSASFRGWRGSFRRWSPRTRSPGCWRTRGRRGFDVLCLSGRGDKDLAEVARAGTGEPGDDSRSNSGEAPASHPPAPTGAATGEERIAEAFEEPARKAGRR